MVHIGVKVWNTIQNDLLTATEFCKCGGKALPTHVPRDLLNSVHILLRDHYVNQLRKYQYSLLSGSPLPANLSRLRESSLSNISLNFIPHPWRRQHSKHPRSTGTTDETVRG